MAIQIPKGDNLGWGMPQARRTVIQGGDDPVGRALIGAGREIGGLAIRINREQQQQKESQDRVNMANGMLEHEKQVNGLLKTANDKMNAGELKPDQVSSFIQSGLDAIPTNDYMPQGMSADNQERWNLNIKTVNQSAFFKGQAIEETGIKTNAVTSINQLINNAKETNLTPDQVLEMLRSEDVKKTASLGFGIKSQEQLDNLARGYTFDYLQNQAISASDKGDYKALKQLRENANNKDFYKDVLQQDDRVRLANSARVGLDQIDQRYKRLQAEAKQAANEQYRAVRNSLFIELDNGKRFDELDPTKVAFVKEHDFGDYASLKSYDPVKHDDLNLVKETRYAINSGVDIDLSEDKYMHGLTYATRRAFVKEIADLNSKPEKANKLYTTTTLINSRLAAAGVKDKQEIVDFQDKIMDAIEVFKEEKKREPKQEEIKDIADNLLVKVNVERSWLPDKEKLNYQLSESEREKLYIDDINKVPAKDKQQITDALKVKGLPVTNDSILYYFSMGLKNVR